MNIEEVVNSHRTTIQKLSHTFYLGAIKMPEKYNWDDNAALWYSYFSKEATKVVNIMTYELESKAFKALCRQLQSIGEEEFEKLKLRIDEYFANLQVG